MATAGDQPDCRKIYIGNLRSDITEDDLEIYCRRYGDVSDVHIPKNPFTKQSKKIGFLMFKEAKGVDKILSEQTHVINSQVVIIKKAHQRIFVYDVPIEVTDQDLIHYFLKFGPIVSVNSNYEYDLGKPKRSCIIVFETDNAVRKLEQLHIVKGMMVKVRIPALRANAIWEDPDDSTSE